MKVTHEPSLFFKALPTFVAVFDDSLHYNRLQSYRKAYIIRRSFKFIDTKELVKQINDLMHSSKRGVLLDLRFIDNKLDIEFLINVAAKNCWRFGKYKTISRSRLVAMDKDLHILCPKSFSYERVLHRTACGDLARELASEPANMIGGTSGFCDRVKGIFNKRKAIQISTLNADDLKNQGLGLINGMGGASNPKLLILEYTPKPANQHIPTICLIGKGVCFDAGGYSLKDRVSMYGENVDKTGAACVIGTVKFVCDSALPIKVIAIIPLIENKISEVSVVPGDVLKSYNGLTVEITNTDAEGRVIVADAIAYACDKYNPDMLVDIGTFTSWASKQHCGLSHTFFTLDDSLSMALDKFGSTVGERCVRLPPWEEYIEYTRGTTADLTNSPRLCVGEGNIASLFLMNFVSHKLRKHGWVHIDISNHEVDGHRELSNCNGIATCIELVRKFRVK